MLTNEQVNALKGKGFLRNRGTDCFSGRMVAAGGVYSAEDLAVISEIAEKCGSGKVVFTSRMCAEIVGIPYEKTEEAIAMAAEHGLVFGGTGTKIRPITSCKGTTCVYGNFDTQALAKKLHEQYYLGWHGVSLPHKIKIGIGGCPNSCNKPSLNDFGIEGHRVPDYDEKDCKDCKKCRVEERCPSKAAHKIDGRLVIDKEKCRTCGVCTDICPFDAVKKHNHVVYKIFVGGTWGKDQRMGTPLSRMVEEDEILPLLEKTILWFKENALPKERLGKAIDRLGFETFEAAIASDDLLNRKEEILSR